MQEAFLYPDEEDRRAVIEALGALRHPNAAQELANIYALRGNDMTGMLALEQLRRQGDLLASPALRIHLNHKDPAVRRQVVMMLAEFQEPAALSDLILMLNEDRERLRIIALIAGIAGQDVTSRNDRVEHIRRWYLRNRAYPQATWFLNALREQNVATTLSPVQFGAGSGTASVPELVRIMLEVQQPYLRSLAARMLRLTTGEDYGVVGPLTDEDQRSAIAERYSVLIGAEKTASGK